MTSRESVGGSPHPLPALRSAANARIKAARKLHQGRARRQQGRVLLEGRRLIETAVAAGVVLETLFVLAEDDALADGGTYAVRVSPDLLRRVATTQHPQDVVAVGRWRPRSDMPVGLHRLLVLDEIADPGNVGTLIRTAAGFGCGAVALTRSTCDPTNPKVLRASAGAVFQVPIVTGFTGIEAVEAARERGLRTVAAVRTGGEAPQACAEDWALFLGNEARGLAAEVVGLVDEAVSIPLALGVESLNAATAGAVILYAFSSTPG